MRPLFVKKSRAITPAGVLGGFLYIVLTMAFPSLFLSC